MGIAAGAVFLPQPKPPAPRLSMQQRGIQIVGAVLGVGAMLGALLVLYTGIDASAGCAWCQSISCISSPFWDCEAIELAGRMPECRHFSTGAETDVLQCGKDISSRMNIPSNSDDEALVRLCVEHC